MRNDKSDICTVRTNTTCETEVRRPKKVEQNRLYKLKRKLMETAAEKKENKKRKRSGGNEIQKQNKLDKARQCNKGRISQETADQKQISLDKNRQNKKRKISQESEDQKQIRLDKARQSNRKRISQETEDEKGGQRGYSGHCINLPQNIQELASSLPRYPKDLPVIIVKMKRRDNTFRYVTVRKQKVHHALLWLMENNPHYADLVLNVESFNSLPDNSVPSELFTVQTEDEIRLI